MEEMESDAIFKDRMPKGVYEAVQTALNEAFMTRPSFYLDENYYVKVIAFRLCKAIADGCKAEEQATDIEAENEWHKIKWDVNDMVQAIGKLLQSLDRLEKVFK